MFERGRSNKNVNYSASIRVPLLRLKEFSTSWKRLIKCQLAAEKRLQEGTGVKPSDVRICYARYIDALRFVCWEIEIQRRKDESSAATV